MKTYYISFEEQGWLENIVKMEAKSEDEAILKACYTLLSQTKDITTLTKAEAFKLAEDNDICVIDEDGEELLDEDCED